MMNFNLINEPCISVKYTDGHKDILNLFDVLAKAQHIKEIDYKYPVKAEMFAIYRFLMELACDIFRPADNFCIYDIFNEGCFDQEQISRYFKENHDRFDLFDKDHPFMQVPRKYFTKDTSVCINTLSPILREGHNDCFYFPERTHFLQEKVWTPDHVIGSLLFWSMSHVGTGRGNKASILGESGKTPLYTLYEGEDLFTTIILGMRPVSDGVDIPYWRRDIWQEGAKLPDFRSLMGYEFYPVMKLLLDDAGFKDGKFTSVFKEMDDGNPALEDLDVLSKIRNSVRGIHPSIHTFEKDGGKKNKNKDDTDNGKDQSLGFEGADTPREYWLDIGTTAVNKALRDAKSKDSIIQIMEEEDNDNIPKKLNVSYYGVYVGQEAGQYRNLYASYPDIPLKILCDSERQNETEKLARFIAACGRILVKNSIEYAKAKFPTSEKDPKVKTSVKKKRKGDGVCDEYATVNVRFFRDAKVLFIDKYLHDAAPDNDKYTKEIISKCRHEFENLQTISNDEITKCKWEGCLMAQLKEEKEKIYGS